jgi:hypothetical protein
MSKTTNKENLIEINKPWGFDDDQSITVFDKKYNIHAAVTLARDVEVKELLIEDMYISYKSPCDGSLRSFMEHVKSVNEADLEYPILLNEDGYIIDGRHRLAKAILTGCKTIKSKRFKKDPSPCYIWV